MSGINADIPRINASVVEIRVLVPVYLAADYVVELVQHGADRTRY